MPGILDALMSGNRMGGNPFAATNGSGSGTMASDMGMLAQAPSAPAPAMATSQQTPFAPAQTGQGYSPLRDPEGPLARAGWIGALLAQGPSKTEYLTGIEEQKDRQKGMARSKAFQTLGKMVQDGLPPQQAFLKFLSTPEGIDFVVTDDDPQAAIGQFLKMAQPDPTAQARAAVFGGDPTATNAATPAGQPQNGNSAIQPNGQGAPVTPGNPLAGVDRTQLRVGAQKLAAIGDYEGANLALKMADGYDSLAKEPTTDELKEYNKTVEQETAAGRTPPSWLEYKLQVANAGSVKLNTTQGKEAAQMQARIDIDKDVAKAAGEAALGAQKALPVLDEIVRLGKNVPGGYKGALLPYFARAAESFGVKVDPSWTDAQVIQAMTQQLLPLVRQPGQVSNYEQQTYMNALPGLMQTQEGRIKIANILRKQGERAMQVAAVYRDNIGAPDLQQKLAELDKPMFSEDEINEFTEIANQPQMPEAKSPTGQMAPGATRQWQGKTYRLKGGDYHDQSNWEVVK